MGTELGLGAQRTGAWLDRLMALLAVVGMSTSVLADLHIRSSSFAGSDIKTVYASVICLVHGQPAYDIGALKAVFAQNGVVQPADWFAHSPVYPPWTLALLIPLALLPMGAAAYAVVVFSAIVYALAVAALMDYAACDLKLALPWRAVLVVLCAVGPLFAFALSMGNLSVLSGSLALLAVLHNGRTVAWLPASELAIAVTLKPHLAVWVLLGLWLLPGEETRSVAKRATSLAAGFVLIVAAVLACAGLAGEQLHGYSAILQQELTSGSMSPASRIALPVAAEVTSLHSLLAFWLTWGTARGLSLLVLAGPAIFLARLTRGVRTPEGGLLAIAGWISLGLMCTYHRAHDALLLILLLPWALSAIRRRPLGTRPWVVLTLLVTMSVSLPFNRLQTVLTFDSGHGFLSFLLFRQASLAAVLLFLVLLDTLRVTVNHNPGRVVVAQDLFKQGRAAFHQRNDLSPKLRRTT